MLESCQDPGGNTNLSYGIIMTRIIKAMGVDVSSFPVKEISYAYNDRAFYSIGYVLDEGVWVKKASYKPKVKPVSAEGPSSVRLDDAQGAVLNSLLFEAQEIKHSLGVVVGDLHKCTELLRKLSTDMTSLQAQLSLIQREGVKSFNLVLKQVDSVAAESKKNWKARRTNQEDKIHEFYKRKKTPSVEKHIHDISSIGDHQDLNHISI
ncbi:hypothetical protein HAX54_023828 [Datura stramonium]|uniref:Uncharacterized protein n=1 Tax=Datura stramonium TaxID=4076 RepID=A0ABS8UYJ5_DATST|nr:hypothetical protein [Datura stramonium]